MSAPIGPKVCGETAADRLMRSLDYRGTDAELITRAQAAVVLHALADHTALSAALAYSRGGSDEPWPDALSLGRWLHGTADQLEDR